MQGASCARGIQKPKSSAPKILLEFRQKKVFFYQNCSDLLLEKNCSSDWEKLLKFEAEGQECSNFLWLLEQLIQTVKGQNNFW